MLLHRLDDKWKKMVLEATVLKPDLTHHYQFVKDFLINKWKVELSLEMHSNSETNKALQEGSEKLLYLQDKYPKKKRDKKKEEKERREWKRRRGEKGDKEKEEEKQEKKEIKCWNCGRIGHKSTVCHTTEKGRIREVWREKE
eukprot:Phypoly_transcript_12380.p1 GENE.Phypoly_transcript_12380~~Phypoly_transcript_12380.p1  ORF type:complete len:142 (+),score=50.43 Phypoly_transcript_12380:290-715(+)